MAAGSSLCARGSPRPGFRTVFTLLAGLKLRLMVATIRRWTSLNLSHASFSALLDAGNGNSHAKAEREAIH